MAGTIRVIVLPDSRIRIETGNFAGATHASATEAIAALARGMGFVALVLASVNIFGGFLVTQRMLAMYKKKG